MSVATDLQTAISRIGLAVAGGENYSRVDLERLQRELSLIAEEARAADRLAFRLREAGDELADGVMTGLAQGNALVSRFRAQTGSSAGAVS